MPELEDLKFTLADIGSIVANVMVDAFSDSELLVYGIKFPTLLAAVLFLSGFIPILLQASEIIDDRGYTLGLFLISMALLIGFAGMGTLIGLLPVLFIVDLIIYYINPKAD